MFTYVNLFPAGLVSGWGTSKYATCCQEHSGSQKGLGLQGSGPKKRDSRAPRPKKSGLQGSIAATLRAPGSTARNDQGSRPRNDRAPGSTAKKSRAPGTPPLGP